MTAAPRRLQNSDQRREVNCCRLVGMNVELENQNR